MKLPIFTTHTKFSEIEQSTKYAFTKVKEELDEHLEAINQNTTDTQLTQEALFALEARMAKLEEKFDAILTKLGEEKSYNIEPLTLREQEVFIALYTTQEYKPCTYKLLVQKTSLPLKMVEEIIEQLILKGVPINRTEKNAEYQLELDSDFKQLQTKSNILNLHKDMIQHIVHNT